MMGVLVRRVQRTPAATKTVARGPSQSVLRPYHGACRSRADADGTRTAALDPSQD